MIPPYPGACSPVFLLLRLGQFLTYCEESLLLSMSLVQQPQQQELHAPLMLTALSKDTKTCFHSKLFEFPLVGTPLSLPLPSLEMVKNDLNHARDDVFSNMIMPVEPLRSASHASHMCLEPCHTEQSCLQ